MLSTNMSTQITTMAKFEVISATKKLSMEEPKLNLEKVILPRRATPGSAGYDFFNPIGHIVLTPGASVVIPTGVKCYMEPGWVLKIYPRSGLGFKFRVGIANTVGIIDSDYYNNKNNEGHIKVKLINNGPNTVEIPSGSAFCQGVFVPYGITYDDDPVGSERVGGFGSSDNAKLPQRPLPSM